MDYRVLAVLPQVRDGPIAPGIFAAMEREYARNCSG
jgi:hypothetical protein